MPSAVLSATLPVKPSVTTTSTVPAAMSSPSTKPWNSPGRFVVAQHRRRLSHLVPLHLLGADVQQADGRLGQAQHGAREDLAHDRELDQVVGVAFDIGAEVEHHAFAAHASGRTTRSPAGRCPAASSARTSPSPSARRYCRRRRRHAASPFATASMASRMLESAPVAQREPTACRRRLHDARPCGGSSPPCARRGNFASSGFEPRLVAEQQELRVRG